MSSQSEAPENSCERPSSISEWRQIEDRDLADMLLDSREIPRKLPAQLAALVTALTEVIRGRKTLGLSDGVIIAAPPTPELQADLGRVDRSGLFQ
jgi:hypothetical protein